MGCIVYDGLSCGAAMISGLFRYIFALLFCAYTVIFAWVICVAPAYSLVGYARVVDEAALYIAKKAAVREAVAIAASGATAATGTSLGLRLLLGGTGWLGLGIMLGLTALDIYYSYQDLKDVNEAASTGGEGYIATVNGQDYTVSGYVELHEAGSGGSFVVPQVWIGTQNQPYLCSSLSTRDFTYGPVGNYGASNQAIIAGWPASDPAGTGYYHVTCGSVGMWNSQGQYLGAFTAYYLTHFVTGSAQPAVLEPAAPPTQQEVADWLEANPSHQLNPDNRRNPVGIGASPQIADDIQTITVSSTDVATSLKPVDQIAPTDIVLGDGFPAPQGTQTIDNQTQTLTQTRTETVTANPDGSTTTQTEEEETATAACTGGSHSEKTTGTVIQEHIDRWQQSGLLASLSGLKNIVWSSTLPTIMFTSARWGTHSINMNDWAWVFASVKVVMIAGATFVSYRLVFG